MAERQGHFCIWHGLSFGDWIRLLASRPVMHWSRMLHIASITAGSLLNSSNNLLASLIYGRRVAKQKIEHPPIFIIGHWRSGTTLLHNLLSFDPQFTYPNLYNVMYPANFLLTEKVVARLTGWMLPATRQMDNISVSWNMPQEDEMAMLLLTLISPYLMVAHQGNPPKYRRYFDMTELTPDERRRWQQAFLTFLKRLTVRENKPIVLKSPSHTFRVPILLEIFPDAKFVYIYRDPYAVYSSTIHLRRTLFAENGLGKPVYEGMEEEVFQLYIDCIETYESTKQLIPSEHLHEVKFEDLEADPLGEMQRVYEGIGLSDWDKVEPAILGKLPEIRKYRKNLFTMDETLMRRVHARWQRAFELYGYPTRCPQS